jgi:hypothetical protein
MRRLSKKELIELVKNICEGNYNSEEERHDMLEVFMYNVPHPEAPNLIFYHKPRLTPEEIVDKALSYQPIILDSPSKTNN